MTAHWGSVAADTLGRVHVVCVEAPSGVRQVYYRRSINSGQSFSPPVQLTSGSSSKAFGSIYTDRTNMVHVAWQDNRDGNAEIYYIRSTDGGSSWGSETRLTADPGSSGEPNLTADLKGNVYLVWTDNRPDEDVYFKYSTDNGNTWSGDACLTNGAIAEYGQFFPNIACREPGDYLHVAWKDYRDGNKEVYYKRSYDDIGIREGTQEAVSSSMIRISPNPFSMRTTINIGPEQGAEGGGINNLSAMSFTPNLRIYDASGRLVRQWDGQTIRQSVKLVWDGTDDFNRPVDAGVYFMKYGTCAEKIIFLK